MKPEKLSILAIQTIRKSFERKVDERIMDESFIFYMKYLLMCKGNELLQMEAAWIFTNIAAGSSKYTKIVVDSGAVPLLIKLISSKNRNLVEQAIWALGNIIGDDEKYRDLILSYGLLNQLLSFVQPDMTTTFQRTIAWVFVNIVRFRNIPLPLDSIRKIIPKLCFLANRRDISTKIDAIWALTFITDCSEDYIQVVVDNAVVEQVIPMLAIHSQKLQIAIIRLLGNIATGTDEQTEILLDNGLLNNITFAVVHPNKNLRRIALWCLSNISIGTQHQAQEIFHSDLLPLIVENLHFPDTRVVKEAILTVRNLINAGSIEQMIDIMDCHATGELFHNMLSNESEIAEAAATSLNTLFSKGALLVDKYSSIFRQH